MAEVVSAVKESLRNELGNSEMPRPAQTENFVASIRSARKEWDKKKRGKLVKVRPVRFDSSQYILLWHCYFLQLERKSSTYLFEELWFLPENDVVFLEPDRSVSSTPSEYILTTLQETVLLCQTKPTVLTCTEIEASPEAAAESPLVGHCSSESFLKRETCHQIRDRKTDFLGRAMGLDEVEMVKLNPLAMQKTFEHESEESAARDESENSARNDTTQKSDKEPAMKPAEETRSQVNFELCY